MGLIEDILNEPETIDVRAWVLHNEGCPPSEIAERLRITEEAARRAVIKRWKKDRELASGI